MEIKCPKCRFRFEEDIPDFINEHSCVCPRCGTPFAYTRTESANEEDSTQDAEDKNTISISDGEAGRHPDIKERSTVLSEEKTNAPDINKQPNVNVSNHVNGVQNHKWTGKHVYRNTPLTMSVIITIIVITAVIVSLLIQQRQGITPESDLYNNSDYITDISSTPDKDATEYNERSGQIPKWIEGRWMFRAEFFDIIIDIYGDSIIESECGHTSAGTYTYKNGKLICDFGNKSTFIYHLNFTEEAIDCGNGLIMRKVK